VSDDAPSVETQTTYQRILIVEDDEDVGESLRRILVSSLGLSVDRVPDGVRALEALDERPYSVVITDLRMPRLEGMRLIREIQARRLNATIIVTTGHGSIGEAVEAMRNGAYEFLTKPLDAQHLCLILERALRERAQRDELIALRAQLQEHHSFQNVLSKNPRMLDIFDQIGNVAETTTTILIEGETGTGKEQIARAIHQASSTFRKGPIVVVNCAALPENLLESELFGHEKGSFTGAATQRKGRFELADGGTLFLDEVGDIPASMQVKLLRVLQERQFERVGGSSVIEVDVRIIAATNRSLETLVKEGKFREDLYYRLNVFKLDLPPLRERPEDIPLLVTHFTQKYVRHGQAPCQISAEAMELILGYNWPGNIRQLENAIERAAVTAKDGAIRPENLPVELTKPPREKVLFPIDLSRPLPEQLEELGADFEVRYLRAALEKTGGHIGRCATLCGLSRRSITYKVAQYKLDTSTYKKD
jgi:DNA-binding NtrC family response regulator